MEQITDGSYHSSDHEEGAREEKEEDVRTSKVHVSDANMYSCLLYWFVYIFVFVVSIFIYICTNM